MQSYTFDVVVTDAVTNATSSATIPKGIPVFDWGENDFNFNVPVYINGTELVEYIVSAAKQRGLL